MALKSFILSKLDHQISAAKSTRPARPAPNPILDPEGQPDTPLFAPLGGPTQLNPFFYPGGRVQPDLTRQPEMKKNPLFCLFSSISSYHWPKSLDR